jgi:membrane associated rhomboid family serine protease
MASVWRTLTSAVRRVPVAISALIGATTIVSVVAAVAARNGMPGPLVEGLLVVPQVWRGELWRLATWVLYETRVLSLVFSCLTLFWFGRDLAARWGARRFVAVYFGLAAGTAALTCLVALLWPAVAEVVHGGAWPVLCGLMVAWGLLAPDRPLSLFGVVPLRGRHLVWLTVGGTILFALIEGAAAHVPHFAAELIVFVVLGPLSRSLVRRQHDRLEKARAWSFDDWLARDRRR